MIDDPRNDSQCVFQGARFAVHSMNLPTRSGAVETREFIAHPGAAVIIPLLDDNHIVMIKNYRFAVNETLLELPAGTLELGEEPIETAKRELAEETGYRAGRINEFTSFYPSPGICNELMITYVASELSFVGQNLDDVEEISVEIVAIDQLKEMVAEGLVRDAKSLCSLLLYFSSINQQKQQL